MTRPTSPLKTLLAAAAVAVLALGAPAMPALAQSSSIKVVVNDDAVTSMDVSNRARLLQIANKLAPAAAQKAALEELVNDTLRLQEAKRRGVVIPEGMVDQAISEIAGRSKMNPSQFAQALRGAGVDIRTLKDRIRVQMAWGRVVRAKVQQSVRQEQDDLIAQMRRQEKSASDLSAEDYVLQRIVFTLPSKAGAADVDRRRKEAENLRARFKGCDSGIALAKQLREVAVLNVGRKLASEVPAGFRDMLKETPEGGLTKPSVADNGIEMFAVCQKIQVQGESAVTAGLDAETLNEQGKKVSEQLTQELRQKANITYR